LIIDNLSLYSSAGQSSDSGNSSGSQYTNNKPAYLNNKNNYVIEDFRDAKSIQNMFIDKDGCLCKRKSTYKVTNTVGLIDVTECVIDGAKIIFYLDTSLKLYKCIYNDALGKYASPVFCVTIPSSDVKTKENIKLFFCDNNLYIVGGGIYYKYLYKTAITSGSTDASKVLAGLANTAYIPLIKRGGISNKTGQPYEIRNVLTKQVRVTLNTSTSTSVYWLGKGIESVDKVIYGGTVITDWTWEAFIYNTSLTFTRSFDNNNEEPLEVWYTLKDEDTNYQNIINASNVSVLSYNSYNLICLYNSNSLNISHNKLLTESDKVDYFKSGSNLYVSLHLTGNILNIIPLANNKFAVITDTNITICSIHHLLDTETNQYNYTAESDYIINDLNILYNSKSTGCENTIYCTLNNYNIGIIKIDPIYNKYTYSIVDLSELYDTHEYSTELYKYNGIYYNTQENHLHIYGDIELVYDLNYNTVYIYTGSLHARDKIVADDVIVDASTIIQIYNGQYGIDNDTFYTGSYESKYLDLGNPTVTKIIDSISTTVEKCKSTNTAISSVVTIVPSTDMSTITRSSCTSDITNAGVNVPIVSSSSVDSLTANSISIKVSLPSNIYKLYNIIFKRTLSTSLMDSNTGTSN